MEWKLSNDNDLQDIINFLLNDEWLHIQALSMYIDNGKFFSPNSSNVITIIKRIKGKIDSLVVITSRGLIYPIFSTNTLWNINDKQVLIKIIANINMRVHGVLGLSSDVEFLDSILFNRIRGINNYLILHRPIKEILSINKNLNIKKASVHDLNRLIPLEYAYQKEEVLLNPDDLNKRATKENFRNKLKKDDTYYIDSNIPLAKASTTFKSLNYVLIGGVFTWEEKRSQGYGTELLSYLLNDQLSKGFSGALFVKKDNKAALHIYEKLGFVEEKPYKINYYFN